MREYDIRGPRRRFDATMILAGGRIVDYLGTHQHLAVDLDLAVDEEGALILTSDAQRFYEGPLAFRFPMLFSGRARLRERFDDRDGRFHVDLEVRNRPRLPLRLPGLVHVRVDAGGRCPGPAQARAP